MQKQQRQDKVHTSVDTYIRKIHKNNDTLCADTKKLRM